MGNVDVSLLITKARSRLDPPQSIAGEWAAQAPLKAMMMRLDRIGLCTSSKPRRIYLLRSGPEHSCAIGPSDRHLSGYLPESKGDLSDPQKDESAERVAFAR